jgi:hypothetical protein
VLGAWQTRAGSVVGPGVCCQQPPPPPVTPLAPLSLPPAPFLFSLPPATRSPTHPPARPFHSPALVSLPPAPLYSPHTPFTPPTLLPRPSSPLYPPRPSFHYSHPPFTPPRPLSLPPRAPSTPHGSLSLPPPSPLYSPCPPFTTPAPSFLAPPPLGASPNPRFPKKIVIGRGWCYSASLRPLSLSDLRCPPSGAAWPFHKRRRPCGALLCAPAGAHAGRAWCGPAHDSTGAHARARVRASRLARLSRRWGPGSHGWRIRAPCYVFHSSNC